MKLGTIKAEALKIMFLTGSDVVEAENIRTLEGEEAFRPYLFAMTGSINRCLCDVEARRILPTRLYPLSKGEAEEWNGMRSHDLGGIADFYDIERVTASGVGYYEGDCPYFVEGSTLLLPKAREDASYTLLYYPKIRRLTEAADNTGELEGIPEEIAALIPYYVKGDLYREDEPNEAGEARNWYESGMALLSTPRRTEKQSRVHTVYSQVEL